MSLCVVSKSSRSVWCSAGSNSHKLNARSGGAPTKAPRWDLADTEGCGGGNSFSWCSWMVSGYEDIYRQRKSIQGATRGPRGSGRAHPYWACRPPSWLPRLLLDVHSKSPSLSLFQKDRSRRFQSVWTPFDIPFLRYTEIGKKIAIRVGPPISRLVPKMI